MIQQIATVTRIIDEHRAEVEVQRKSACGHDCSKCGGGCSEMMVKTSVAVVAENLVNASPGDRVQVESSAQTVLGAAVVVYLVPFLLFFVGYMIGVMLEWSSALAVAAGGAGFVLGLLLAIWKDRSMKKKNSISFRITAYAPAE